MFQSIFLVTILIMQILNTFLLIRFNPNLAEMIKIHEKEDSKASENKENDKSNSLDNDMSINDHGNLKNDDNSAQELKNEPENNLNTNPENKDSNGSQSLIGFNSRNGLLNIGSKLHN